MGGKNVGAGRQGEGLHSAISWEGADIAALNSQLWLPALGQDNSQTRMEEGLWPTPHCCTICRYIQGNGGVTGFSHESTSDPTRLQWIDFTHWSYRWPWRNEIDREYEG